MTRNFKKNIATNFIAVVLVSSMATSLLMAQPVRAASPKDSVGSIYPVTLTAKSNTVTSTQVLSATVGKIPVFKSIPAKQAKGKVGTPYSLTVVTTGFGTPVVSLSSELPAGLSLVDNGDGTATISGTPQVGAGGVHPIMLTAENFYGSSSKTFDLKLYEAPTINSYERTSPTSGGLPSEAQVTAYGFPAPHFTISEALPRGMHFNGKTGKFSGSPKVGTEGFYYLTITATNSQGTSTQNFILQVLPCRPIGVDPSQWLPASECTQ